MKQYLKITFAVASVIAIAGVTYFTVSYKELKKVNTIEGVNTYMANPVPVNYPKDLVVRLPENLQVTDTTLQLTNVQ